MIDMIIKADGDVEYSVPDDAITPELLEGGSFLKRAIGICNRNRTRLKKWAFTVGVSPGLRSDFLKPLIWRGTMRKGQGHRDQRLFRTVCYTG